MTKNKNTFKFKTFDELLETELTLKKYKKLEVNAESYLKECFEKWNTLNASLEFVELRNTLGPKIMTLELMLLNIDDVIELLFQYLDKGTSLSIYTILDMLQSLVCDIREDILPHLPRVFSIINKLVDKLNNDADSADLVLSAFSCIGHIIYYLESTLIKGGNIADLLPLIKPLLFYPKKPFVRKFTAQCMAFLVRRIKEFSKFFSDVILDQLVDEHTSNHSDAIGKLMSSCLKTKESLLSSAPRLFLCYFDILYSRDNDVEFVIACFDEMFKDLLASVDDTSYRKLWQLMVDKISSMNGEQSQELELLTIELFFKSAQHKKLHLCSKMVTQKVKALVTECPSDKVVEIVKIVIDKLPVSHEIIDLIRSVILSKDVEIFKKFEFIKSYISNDKFDMVIKNSTSDYLSLCVTEEWLQSAPENLHLVLQCMSDLITTKYPIGQRSSWKEQLANNSVNFNFFFLKNDNSALIYSMMEIVKGELKSNELLWMTLIVLPHIYPANIDERFVTALQTKIDTLFLEEFQQSTLIDISCVLECMALLGSIQKSNVSIPINSEALLSILSTYDFSSPVEPIILEILSKSLSVDSAGSKHREYESMFIEKLKSPSHMSRLSALEILKSLLQEDALDVCYRIEEMLELKETMLANKSNTLNRIMDDLKFKAGMTDLSKRIIISYLLGAMHVNFVSLWKFIIRTLSTYYEPSKENMKLIEQIKGSNETIIWNNIKSQLEFCAFQDSKGAKDVGLMAEYCCEQQETYIRDKFYTGRDVDWLTYRLNMIKALTKVPELAGRKTSVLSPLLLSVYSDEVCANKDHSKIRKTTLSSLLYLFSKMPNITCTHSESKCRQLYYKCLSSRQPDLQKSAFLVLVNYKMPELEPYKDKILHILEKGVSDLKEMSLAQVITSHRAVVLPIMTRIIVGKLKKTGKVQKQKPMIGYLTELADKEMGQLLTVLMESVRQFEHEYETVDPNENIVTISGTIKELIESHRWPREKMHGLFKTLHGLSNSLNGVLVSMVNKLSDEMLTSVLLVVLDFYDCCTSVRARNEVAMDTDDSDDHVPTALFKQTRQLCASMVLFYFQKIEDFPWTEALLSRVTYSIVAPQAPRMVDENQSSPNTTILLSVLWCDNDKFLHLITPDLFASFAALLCKQKLNRERVGYKLVNIVFNVMERMATDEHCGTLVRANLPQLIEYLVKRVTAMRPYGRMCIGGQDSEHSVMFKELTMVSVCMDLLVGTEDLQGHMIEDMITSVLALLSKSNPLSLYVTRKDDDDENKEKIEVKFLRALETMLCVSSAETVVPYMGRLFVLMSRLRRRASRTVLSATLARVVPQVLSVVAVPEQYHGLADLSVRLNSWNESRLEEMDYDLMTDTLKASSLCLKAHPVEVTVLGPEYGNAVHPALWLYHATAMNCLYIMTEVEEMGPRELATDFLRQLIASIAASGDETALKGIFFGNIWPFITSVLNTKNEMCHLTVLSLVKSILVSLADCDRFVDIAKLAHSHVDEKDFFEGMLSLAELDKTKALKKLTKFFKGHRVSSNNLREVIKPLLFFRLDNLNDQSHTDRQRSSIKSLQNQYSAACLEALTAFAEQCPHALYKKMVATQMDKIDKGTDVETSIRVLISLLNGYGKTEGHEDMIAVLHDLEKHLARKDPSADRHKKAQKSTPEDLLSKKNAEWTMRGVCLQVPIANAMINIAIKLPKKAMKESVTRVIIRLCTFLKSNDAKVRRQASDTISEILLKLNGEEMVEAGEDVRYLNFVVHTIKSNLSRGFQRHVGLFTCHAVMQRLIEKKVFDRLSLEFSTMTCLTEMYLDEQFGEMAKEKAERHDAEKGMIREAATDKAYAGLLALSQVICKSDLVEFLSKLIQTAKEIRSQKSLNKIKTIIESLRGGLIKNERLDPVTLFTIALVHINENVNALFNLERQSTSSFATNVKRKAEELHLYKAPARLDGYTECTAKATGHNYSYLVVNFGFTLLNALIKANKNNAAIDLRSMLEPCVDRVIEVLSNVSHKDIMTSALKCLKEMVHVCPPRLDARVKDVGALLFKLHDTNSFFRDKHELSSMVFYKTLTQFIQRPDVVINHNQYKVLLLGIELDTFNHKLQMHSVYLLKAIINRRISEPIHRHGNIALKEEVDVQIVDVVDKIKPIAVKSSSERTRSEARAAITCFLRHYKKDDAEYVCATLTFFLKSLINEVEDGQISACLMIQTILAEFPAVVVADGSSKQSVVGYAVLAMRRGLTDKVERALSFIVTQLMGILESDDQTKMCDLVMAKIETNPVTVRDVGLCVFLMATMAPSLSDAIRLNRSKRFVELLCIKLPCLVDQADKLSGQIIALSGEDAALMADLAVRDKAGLVEDRATVARNIDHVLMAVSAVLAVVQPSEADLELRRHLTVTGLASGLWSVIFTKLLQDKHARVRLHAAREVVQVLLRFEVEYESDTDSLFTADSLHQLLDSTLLQFASDSLSAEECDVVLVNLLFVWRVALSNFEGEARTRLLRQIVNRTNQVANEELEANETLMRRIAALKLLAGVMARTSADDLATMDLERNIVWMWMREERQLKNDAKKKKSDSLPRKEVEEWSGLVVSLGQIIETSLGESFKELKVSLTSEREANKRKRKMESAALAISNPAKFISAEKRRKMSKK